MTAAGERLGPTLFERSRPGRGGGKIPHSPKDALARIPAGQLRAEGPRLPEVSEPELTRHYVNLSQLNYSVDGGFYPLGSCTMKYNPKIDEWAARLPGFSSLHPLAPDELAQGTLQLLWELEQALAEIGGMKAVTLQPAAGAQGNQPAGPRQAPVATTTVDAPSSPASWLHATTAGAGSRRLTRPPPKSAEPHRRLESTARRAGTR